MTKKNNNKTKNSKTTPNSNNNSKKFFISVFVLISVCLISFTALYFLFPPQKKKLNDYTKQKTQQKISAKKPVLYTHGKKALKTNKDFLYEIYDKIEEKALPVKKLDYKGLPKICIIIDDIGFDKNNAYELADLGINITLSVLPFTPYAKEIINNTSHPEVEFMLHIPMEPVEYPIIDPGQGALLSSMDPDTIIFTLKNDLDSFPFIKGINNHMGSKLTQNSDIMNQVFTIIKKRNLFFVDSLTNPNSKCIESARMFKVDFAKRDIFLDNIQKVEYIEGQIKKLKIIAAQKGYSIGIGHPYDTTIKALKNNIYEIKKEFEFVKASSVVKQIQ